MIMLLGLAIVAVIAMAANAAEAVARVENGELGAPAGKFWRIVKNATADGQPTSGTMYVYAGIMADWWDAWGPDDVYPMMFAQELEALGAVDEIHLRVNSPGGSVFAAQTIYNLLKQNSAKVITHIDGMAVSAASIVALAGDEVIMAGNGMMMIHNPMFSTSGDAEQLRADADLLDQIRDTIIAVYSEKTGIGSDELIAMMKAETWMTAGQAKDMGFVDTVVAPIAVTNVAGAKYAVNGVEMDFSGMQVWPGALLATAALEPKAEVEVPDTGEEPTEDPDPVTDPEPEEAPAGDADADPVAAERARIQAIDKRAKGIDGIDELVAQAKYPSAGVAAMTPAEFSDALVTGGFARNASMLNARLQDAEDSQANAIGASVAIMGPLNDADGKAIAAKIAEGANS